MAVGGVVVVGGVVITTVTGTIGASVSVLCSGIAQAVVTVNSVVTAILTLCITFKVLPSLIKRHIGRGSHVSSSEAQGLPCAFPRSISSWGAPYI